MRMVLTAVAAASCVYASPAASAEPAGSCPPVCHRIPATAWIAPTEIPLHSTYAWPKLAGLSVTARSPRFRVEELCGSPVGDADPRHYAVAERSEVSNPGGEWQLRAQVVHWRGETWRGGQLAQDALGSAVAAITNCQATNPGSSASLLVAEPDRVVAAVSGPVVLHQYLLADPVTSTVTELALWARAPVRTPWPAVTDSAVLDALAAPLCTAYLDSCP